MMEVRWKVRLLGGLRVQPEAVPTDPRNALVPTRFRTQKTAILLAYLAYYLDRPPQPRETLAELLWPEGDPRVARNNLSRELSWLRYLLEPAGVPEGSVLLTDRTTVRLHPAAIETDVAAFHASLRAANEAGSEGVQREHLARAVEAYEGPLLAGYYDDWVQVEQGHLAELYFQALGRLIALLEAAGDPRRGLAYASRGVGIDPLREAAHRHLMRLLAAAGEPAAALRQYQELARFLERELGIAPDAASRALARQIERGTLSTQRSIGDRPIDLDARRPELSVERRASRCPWSGERAEGVVPLDSAFYVVRPTDGELTAAIERRDSLVVVQGARQMGKTSLLARGIRQAREAGTDVLLTDLQRLSAAQLASTETFLRALEQWIAVQLDLDDAPDTLWHAGYDPGMNFERYLRRRVLATRTAPLFWALDGADRLFICPWGGEVFALFRSWHNARCMDPEGPWSGLTMAITYATEAHLFISDPNQSPFNVGTRLVLEDFSPEQVASLNRRYGSPLKQEAELARFFALTGGHPYLSRRGLHEMAARAVSLKTLEAQSAGSAGPFADHLRRLLDPLPSEELLEPLRQVLRGRPCPTEESFFRLRGAGVIAGASPRDARPRCGLYAAYLEKRLL